MRVDVTPRTPIHGGDRGRGPTGATTPGSPRAATSRAREGAARWDGVKKSRRRTRRAGTRTIITRRLPPRSKRRSRPGVAPWQKPWTPGERRLPKNIQTDKPYRGGNSVYLSVTQTAKGYSDHRWATYKQIKDMGGQVRKGEKATHVLFYKFDDEREKTAAARPTTPASVARGQAAEKERTRPPMVRCYAVFNVEQADDLKLERTARRPRQRARVEGPPDGRAGDSGERDSRRPRTRRPGLLQHADRQGDAPGAGAVRHGERLLPNRVARTRPRHRPPRPDGPRHADGTASGTSAAPSTPAKNSAPKCRP